MWLNLLILYISTSVLTQAETPDELTQDVIDAFLAAHNAAREKVSAPPLVWDENLSEYAAKWSSNCEFEHSKGQYGENIYASSGDDIDNVQNAQDAVESWNSEIVSVDFPDWTCIGSDTDTCGHYSQVVWKDTTAVGCGITHCESPEILRNFVVCSYDPPGNYEGETPY